MSNPNLFLIKKEEEEEEEEEEELRKFEIVKITEEKVERLSRSTSNSRDSEDKKEENSDNQKIEGCYDQRRILLSKEADSESRTLSSSEEEKLKEKDEEEDGFRTPTSLEHRISVAIKCPPAPRKTKPSLKRRTPYNHCRYPLDLSKEIELLLSTSDSYRSKKKVRREEPK